MHEEWFADEENVRKAVGILEKPVIKSTSFKEVSHQFKMTLAFFIFLSECVFFIFMHLSYFIS